MRDSKGRYKDPMEPLYPNPFAHLRKLAGYSQLGLSRELGLSRSTLVYIETGQYPHLSEYMVTAIYSAVEHKGLDPYEELDRVYGVQHLEEAYKEWCEAERRRNKRLFHEKIDPDWLLQQSTRKYSPFAAYIDSYFITKQRFCKALKVSDAAVFRYSKGEAVEMPLDIEEALKEVNCPYLEDLKEVQRKWLSSY